MKESEKTLLQEIKKEIVTIKEEINESEKTLLQIIEKEIAIINEEINICEMKIKKALLWIKNNNEEGNTKLNKFWKEQIEWNTEQIIMYKNQIKIREELIKEMLNK